MTREASRDEVMRVLEEQDFSEMIRKFSTKFGSGDAFDNAASKWIDKRAEKLWYSKGPFI